MNGRELRAPMWKVVIVGSRQTNAAFRDIEKLEAYGRKGAISAAAGRSANCSTRPFTPAGTVVFCRCSLGSAAKRALALQPRMQCAARTGILASIFKKYT